MFLIRLTSRLAYQADAWRYGVRHQLLPVPSISGFRLTVVSFCCTTKVDCSFFFFSSRRRHTRSLCDWSSDVCSSDLGWCRQCAKEEIKQEKLAALQQLAIGRGGKCLSKQYINRRTGMEWQCAKGHR